MAFICTQVWSITLRRSTASSGNGNESSFIWSVRPQFRSNRRPGEPSRCSRNRTTEDYGHFYPRLLTLTTSYTYDASSAEKTANEWKMTWQKTWQILAANSEILSRFYHSFFFFYFVCTNMFHLLIFKILFSFFSIVDLLCDAACFCLMVKCIQFAYLFQRFMLTEELQSTSDRNINIWAVSGILIKCFQSELFYCTINS